jgi:hypothetical protein
VVWQAAGCRCRTGETSASRRISMPGPLPLSVNEFLTRFLLHILPQGFVRIRHFGSWPTADAPPFYPCAFRCWAQPQNHQPKNTLPLRKTLQIFIAVPSVADP